MNRALRRVVIAALPLLLGLGLLLPARAWAGPVSWVEVPPTAEGRQWWDEGSLRRNRAGNLTVLSRFQALPETDSTAAASAQVRTGEGDAETPGVAGSSPSAAQAGEAGLSAATASLATASMATPAGALPAPEPRSQGENRRPAPSISRLYVMELDCDQNLYRDISINGLPQFGASWQPTGSDDLTAEVLRQACAAEAA